MVLCCHGNSWFMHLSSSSSSYSHLHPHISLYFVLTSHGTVLLSLNCVAISDHAIPHLSTSGLVATSAPFCYNCEHLILITHAQDANVSFHKYKTCTSTSSMKQLLITE